MMTTRHGLWRGQDWFGPCNYTKDLLMLWSNWGSKMLSLKPSCRLTDFLAFFIIILLPNQKTGETPLGLNNPQTLGTDSKGIWKIQTRKSAEHSSWSTSSILHTYLDCLITAWKKIALSSHLLCVCCLFKHVELHMTHISPLLGFWTLLALIPCQDWLNKFDSMENLLAQYLNFTFLGGTLIPQWRVLFCSLWMWMGSQERM